MRNLSDVEIQVYPNPASDFVNFDLDYQDETITKVVVYDLLGTVVTTANVSIEQSYIDVSSLSSGSYIISFELSNAEVMNEKMIIRK